MRLRIRPRLVELLNNSFSVFKQHYTFFHPHVFQKTTNNITQTHLPNRTVHNSTKNEKTCIPMHFWSHGTIHTFKNYFAIVFSAISFQFSVTSSIQTHPTYWKFGITKFCLGIWVELILLLQS